MVEETLETSKKFCSHYASWYEMRDADFLQMFGQALEKYRNILLQWVMRCYTPRGISV